MHEKRKQQERTLRINSFQKEYFFFFDSFFYYLEGKYVFELVKMIDMWIYAKLKATVSQR